MLDRFLFRPSLATNPIDEGAKQPHVGIRGFQYLRGPATRLESQWKPDLDDRKALRRLPFCPRENERQLNILHGTIVSPNLCSQWERASRSISFTNKELF
jgi:hypothetical protein